VSGGSTKYGDVFIGQIDGQIGRITIKTEGILPHQVRKMDQFTYHSDKAWFGNHECLILCATSRFLPGWVPVKRGDAMPGNAVKGGQTQKDGITWVARSSDTEDYRGDIGKVNTDNDRMYNFWCASRKWSPATEAELLILQSAIPVVQATPLIRTAVLEPVPAAAPQASVQPERPQRPPPVDVAQPSAPREFSGVNSLDKEMMNKIRANEPLLDDWLTDQRDVRQYREQAQQARQEQEGVAYQVLAMESDFESSHRAYENSTQDLTLAQSRVQGLLDERQRILQKQSPDELCRILNASAQRSDNQAEQSLQSALGQSALDSEKLTEFKQSYLTQKAEKHKRVALSVRLKQAKGAPGA